MPSSIVSVSFDAYSNGELAVPSPLQASHQFFSCDTVTRAKVFGTFSASAASDSG
jgi:hypothetical protein